MAQTDQFECSGCGAHLEFDPKTQNMKCEFCQSEKIVPIEHKVIVEHDFYTAPKNLGWDRPSVSMSCKSCGATISSETGVAGKCTYCGSPYVTQSAPRADLIRPETLIPFRVDKNKANDLFKHWLGTGWFTPSNLTELSRLHLIKGVYTPFWTYDTNAHSSWTAESGYYYYVTETYTVTVNGRRETRTRQVQKVRWVPSAGQRQGFYNDVLVPASKGMNQELILKIYPFDLNQLVPYKPEFLSGFMAEEYGVDLHQGWVTAQNTVASTERDKCGREVPGDTHRFLRVQTSFNNITYKHILLPVWIAAYEYKAKTYHFLINGQTGEVQGFKPISWAKVALFVAGVAAAVAALAYFFRFY
jgi:DNA-directed RNA polymerase subunit RPC12/RpoP